MSDSAAFNRTSEAAIILGSRSPQRLELLGRLVSSDRIRALPPLDDQEEGFDGLSSLPEILERLKSIARAKADDVERQWKQQSDGHRAMILCADTVVLGHEDDKRLTALGKPDGDEWEVRVREWFTRYYSGRTHQVASAVCLRSTDGFQKEKTVITDVRFRDVPVDLLDWYIATEEPLGKAGGYGLQGAGGMFVENVEGSLSNVIGLPLEACWEMGIRG